MHKIEIDLMQPIDPERAPKVHVPALNHIGLWIDDLPACVEQLTGEGLRFTPGGIRKGAGKIMLEVRLGAKVREICDRRN